MDKKKEKIEKKTEVKKVETKKVSSFKKKKKIKKNITSGIAYVYSTFNNRPAVICKELTKIHETFHRGSLASLIENFGNINLKGEFVILVGKDKDSVYF